MSLLLGIPSIIVWIMLSIVNAGKSHAIHDTFYPRIRSDIQTESVHFTAYGVSAQSLESHYRTVQWLFPSVTVPHITVYNVKWLLPNEAIGYDQKRRMWYSGGYFPVKPYRKYPVIVYGGLRHTILHELLHVFCDYAGRETCEEILVEQLTKELI